MPDLYCYLKEYDSYKKAHDDNEPSKQYKRRISRRLYYNELKNNKRNERLNSTELEANILSQYKRILKNHEKSEKSTFQRPKANQFLSLFAFLPLNQYDKRDDLAGLKEWRSHSFNDKRQTMEFFHTFLYPYSTPEPLIMTSILEDLHGGKNGMLRYSQDFTIIHRSRKWLTDIVSGGSFYRKNKTFFTKAEAHFFLSSGMSYNNSSSVIAMYYEAKCKARNFGQSMSDIVVRVFTIKFLHSYTSPIVTGFLDLLARHTDYHYTIEELGDICDFVNTKIVKYCQSYGKIKPFSFSGRTINSVIALANEWHTQHQREIALGMRLSHLRHRPVLLSEKWEGLSINNYIHENGNCIWTINQLCTINALTNEGRKMKHCVASYAYKCLNNECGIFNVSCYNKSMDVTDSVATIEVSQLYEIVQVKGKCNSVVSCKVINVVDRWTKKEGLKINHILSKYFL